MQGLLGAEALLLDEGRGQIGTTLVVDHCERLPGISWDRRGRGGEERGGRKRREDRERRGRRKRRGEERR